jgi:PspA-Associated protein
MIIRILGEGQFRVDDKLLDRLNKIDNEIVDHVAKGDKVMFKKGMDKLIAIVKEQGEPLDPVDIVQSGLIIPPGDLSFEEAKKIFSGHGLIKD